MPRLNQRRPSAKRAESNRRNAQKSTGPRTPQGKQQVRLNALKHGLHSDPFVQGMLALQEDPRAYYRLLGDLLASLRPANPHQRMQVEDIARLRLEKQRLERACAALVAGKVRELELERERRLVEFDWEAPDLPQAELLHKGLDRAPDSPAKFEKMLSCFDVLISQAKEGQFGLDPEPELNLLYGKEPSLEGAYLRNVFRRFRAAKKNGAGESGSGVGAAHTGGQGAAGHSAPNSARRIADGDDSPGEPECLLLLRTLYAAKQRILRLYQLYNREFVEITPDQRDACFAASGPSDLNLMRQEAQNERQLRWALKLYWETQEEDAARAAQPPGEAREADELLEVLEQSLGSTVFATKQSQEVIENTEAVSGNGQNKVKHGDGEKEETGKGGNGEEPLFPFRPLPFSPALSQRGNGEEPVFPFRPLPFSPALSEREGQKREALEKGLEQTAAAQRSLESKNRRLRAEVGESELMHAQVREQVKPAEVVVVTRREPTREEILQKFRDAIGLSGGEEFESDGQLEDSLSEEELREFRQGRGPAWEELQRRRRERREQEQRLGMR